MVVEILVAIAGLIRLIMLILGMLVINQFPVSTRWPIGLSVGISLGTRGFTLLAIAVAIRPAL